MAIRPLYALLGASEAAFMPFIAILLRARGFDAGEIGATLGAMSLASFVSGPAWGFAADRRLGHERTLTLVAAGAAPLALAVALAPGKLGVALACVALWAWKAPQFGLADAVALARLGGRRAGYGAIRLWFSLGVAIGAIGWGGLQEVAGVEIAPYAHAGMLVLVAFATARLPRVEPPPAAAAGTAAPPARRGSLAAAAAFLASLFLLQAAFFASQNFLALRIVDLGGGTLLVGLARALQAGIEVPVMAWTSRPSNRRRPIELFALGCVLWTGVFTGWALVSEAWAATLINLGAGCAYALTTVSTVVIVDELVPVRYRATGQTVARAVSWGLAPVAGNLAGGAVYGTFGSATMFALAAAAGAVAALAAGVAVNRATR